ncbi:DUF2254 family protein [Paraburkholderia bengalensis]|uniref:DUF2254 family protein n=1 Tax=Paraburkholderia bengalensis TaxID=2747562 RepID=UPI00301477C0
MRPVSLIGRVAEQGFAVIRHIYPYPFGQESLHAFSSGVRKCVSRSQELSASSTENEDATARQVTKSHVVYHRGRSGVVLAVNLRGLAREARRLGCVIEFAAQVGDFIATDEPLFYISGVSTAFSDESGRRLQNLVALGTERTMEQDPMFAFRIEVDIALKALSPAINDPTTAVLAIDQLHRLLRLVGKRSLVNQAVSDDIGSPRVLFRTPDWNDYVHISFREIRQCGAGSLQIERRLRAMIENLIKTLPFVRHAALRRELELLDAVIVREHIFDEDIRLARIADTQGLGGASHTVRKTEER